MSKRDDEIRRLEQLVRDLEPVPDQALKMGFAELVAHRDQCCADEFDCGIGAELADLRWVLTRRAEAAGSIPGVAAFARDDAVARPAP